MKVDELKQRYQLFLKKHALHPEEAVVGAGGALCVLGLRDQTSDIDLDVPSSVFKRLLGMGFPTHVFNGNVLVIEADEFDRSFSADFGKAEAPGRFQIGH